MISRDMYDLMTAGPGRLPTEMKVNYEVMIDETGRPDMSTFKVAEARIELRRASP